MMEQPAYTVTIPGPMKGKGRPQVRRMANFVSLYTPKATVNAEAHVKQCCYQQVGAPMLEGAIAVDIAIAVEIPASWPKKRRADALAGVVLPVYKPDCDNSVKLIFDALNKIAWRDDSQITRLSVSKRYAEKPETILMFGNEVLG